LELFHGEIALDGFCPDCGRQTTFKRSTGGDSMLGKQKSVAYTGLKRFDFDCVRDITHTINFWLFFDAATVQKVGQWPSFADIAIDESKQYRKLLDKDDVREFHKAIGLAAHGVGIGSYVYLRRIFERLIWKRFYEFRETENWDEAAFKGLRMNERISLLKSHLPEFLVRNAKLYSILSLGVHELNEQDCLDFFPVLRQSTIWILEQDKKKQEELAQEAALELAISQFGSQSKIEPE
jgi:hypothetical protein